MTTRLCTCLLFILLMHGPAHGQGVSSAQNHGVGKASTDMPAATLSGSASTSADMVEWDLPSHLMQDAPARSGLTAAGLASKVIEFLAAQNTIDLFRQSTDEMDAFLRPPAPGSVDEDVFLMARAAFRDATSIQSEVYEIAVDPLKMRWVVRINLNRPFGR